ncbi:amino acid permease [Leucobacter chromiireducens]|uniref:APC family permease n=1 Tax=Leucobacter chromiireducens subsp. chromiireducens TaxID=660067 RepID=A0ABS1SQ04_9MICO|nr:APC family permease [Leucobacter chromiireducens subsp. chromiireducens]
MTEPAARNGLKRELGLGGLVLFGLAYMAVATVFTTYGIVNQITEGKLPLAYVIALLTMLFTANSYAAMVRKYPVAGSAYTYTQQAFGGGAGFLTGWVLLLDYLFIPMINFMILGLYVSTQFPSVPAWIVSLITLIAVFVFNVLGINLVNKLNIVIVSISAAAVIIFAVFAIKTAIADPNAPSFIEPFIPGSAGFSPIFTGAGILALSFLGFDAVSTLSEEAKHPRRDIPRAIILTALIGGALFIFVSWVGARAYHLDDWSQAPRELLDAAGVVLAHHVAGEWLGILFVVFTVAGCFGSGLAGQVSVARILYSMGRDGTLPKPLGILWKRFGTPVVAAATVSIVALASLFLTLEQAAFMISFGALAAFAMVNLSVIRVYLFPKRGEAAQRSAKDLILRGLFPLIGFALTIWLWTSLESMTWIVGGIWFVIGLIILMAKTNFFRKPVPRMDFSEGPETSVVDAMGEAVPFK